MKLVVDVFGRGWVLPEVPAWWAAVAPRGSRHSQEVLRPAPGQPQLLPGRDSRAGLPKKSPTMDKVPDLMTYWYRLFHLVKKNCFNSTFVRTILL